MTMLWLPKYQDIVVVGPTLGIQLQGWFKIEAEKADGSGRRRVLADWFPNLITDAGLNNFGTSMISACHVGSGNTAPAVTDTALVTLVGSTNASAAANPGASGTDPYYAWKTYTSRFNPGEADGTLAEIGMSPSTNPASAPLSSRALILDGSQNPTTITVLPDEYLDVTYQVRNYCGLTASDYTQNGVTVTNVGTRNVTWRAASVTQASSWGQSLASSPGLPANSVTSMYEGSLGAITGVPSGSQDSVGIAYNGSYSNNSLQRDYVITASLSQANFAGGIKSFRFSGGCFSYQCEYDTAIPKTSIQTFQTYCRISWGRYTPP